MIEEIWKPIEGYPGYDISNLGRVRSYRIQNKSKRCTIGDTCKIRKLTLGDNGYYHVCLTKYNGRQKTEAVHRLVAKAFLGPCPNGYYTCHNDGNRLHNYLDNLRYDTPKANQADAKRLGRQGGHYPRVKQKELALSILGIILATG